MSLLNEASIRCLGAEVTAASVAGNANTRLPGALGKRSGMLICNEDSALELRVRLVPRGANPPSYTSGRGILRIAPGGTASVAASESVDVYVVNSSNAATTSVVTYQDYAV